MERERRLVYFAVAEQNGRVNVVIATGEDISGNFSYFIFSVAFAGSTMSGSL
jgi:hypothetical protein